MKIKKWALGLLVLTVCVLMQIVSATDYSQAENVCETMLSNPDSHLGIIAPEVSISPYQVTINYIGASTTTEAIMGDVGSILGAYWAIVDKYPEVGDLLITIEDINGNAIGTFACQKNWVYGMDIHDASATQRLALKVMMTVKTYGAAA